MKPLLRLVDVSRTFASGADAVLALNSVNLELLPNEMVALMGPSGSGKSTALSIAGLLLTPTGGKVEISGEEAPTRQRARACLRNAFFGFVYQDYAIIEDISARANVEVPLEYRRPKVGRSQRMVLADAELGKVGVGQDVSRRKAVTLSGGQKQRVSIARAMVNNPSVILADEPTAALDRHSMSIVMDLLAQTAAQGKSVLIATHDQRVAQQCNRVVELVDGRVTDPRSLPPPGES